jgi:hypothetical protein
VRRFDDLLPQREGVALFHIPNQKTKIKIGAELELIECEEDCNPCLLRPGATKDIWVRGERTRAKRFVYKLCIGDLRNGESVRQFCSPRDKKGRLRECYQSKHLYKPEHGVKKKAKRKKK